jgi:hypothetical protein
VAQTTVLVITVGADLACLINRAPRGYLTGCPPVRKREKDRSLLWIKIQKPGKGFGWFLTAVGLAYVLCFFCSLDHSRKFSSHRPPVAYSPKMNVLTSCGQQCCVFPVPRSLTAEGILLIMIFMTQNNCLDRFLGGSVQSWAWRLWHSMACGPNRGRI